MRASTPVSPPLSAVLVVLLAACPLAACGGGSGGDDAPDTDAGPPRCPVGDLTLPLEVIMVFSDGHSVRDLADGDAVPLRQPLQGGQAVMVGVRARNVDACRVSLTTTLRDPDDDRSLGLDVRPVGLRARSDGWAWPSEPYFQSVGSTPACPNNAGDADIHGNLWRIEARLDDQYGRSATAFATIRPFCDADSPLELCECECDADFSLETGCSFSAPGSGSPR